METPFDLLEHKQSHKHAEGATTHASLAEPTFSNSTPTYSSKEEVTPYDPPLYNTKSNSGVQREHRREPTIVHDQDTERDDRDLFVQRHPLVQSNPSDPAAVLDQPQEPSLVDDRATTSTAQDNSSWDAAFNEDGLYDDDPLLDDEKLLWGPRLAQPGDDSNDMIQKVPSDQGPLKFRWGSIVRTTGRAKTGLLIQVPGPQTSISFVRGGPITGNSIMYAYASSSSSSGRTTNSFGAVGDHLSSTKSHRWSLNPMPSVQEDPLIGSRTLQPEDGTLVNTEANARSPLAKLVHNSTPDTPFPLIAVGEIGQLQQPVSAQIVAPSSLRTRRRRSLSDLIEPPPPQSSPIRQELSDAVGLLTVTANPPQEAPVWHRAGPPFFSGVNGVDDELSLDKYLDPEAFSLPYGSKVYIMKAKNLINLRASVRIGVWSSPLGVSRVFQGEWERKRGNEKIIFLFSIIKGHKHNGKYCGMAEMSGPYNPDFNPKIWTGEMQGNEGSIPLRWLVAKEVLFPVFDGQKHNETPVTMMRHGNIVVGEVGRRLIQTYFQHAHGSSTIIHPDYDLVEHGQPTRTQLSQRFSRGRDWYDAQTSYRRQPQQQRHINSALQNHHSNFAQTSTINPPPFRNAYEGHQLGFENLQPYNQTQTMRTPPGRGPRYDYAPMPNAHLATPTNQSRSDYGSQYRQGPGASANFGPPPRLAPILNPQPPKPASHGYQPPIQNEQPYYVPPNMQLPSNNGSHYEFAPRPNTNITSPSRQAPLQYGQYNSSNLHSQPPSGPTGNNGPFQASYFGRPAQVEAIDAAGHVYYSRDHRAGHVYFSHAPPAAPSHGSGFRRIDHATQHPESGPPFQQIAPSNESGFSRTGNTTQPPVAGLRPWEAASINESHVGPITPANARARLDPNFDPLRAPRYHPLGYAAPIRGSHFGTEQSQNDSQPAPQLDIPGFDGSGEYEQFPTQQHPYNWKL